MKNINKNKVTLLVTLIFFTVIGCEEFMSNFKKEENNDPPTLSVTIENDEPAIGTTQTFTAEAEDPEGSEVTISWSVTGGELSVTTGTEVQWTAPSDTQTVEVVVKAEDDKSNVTKKEVYIYVGNAPPQISNFTTSSSHVVSGNSVTLTCSATDAESGELWYSFYSIDGQGNIEHQSPQTNTATWISPSNVDQGDIFKLIVKVTDPLNFTQYDTLDILVYSDFGSIWVVDNGHNSVAKYTANGIKILTVSQSFSNPVAIVSNVDELYGCFVADQNENQVVKIDPEGTVIETYSDIPYVSDIAMHNATRKIWALSYSDNSVTIIDSRTGDVEKKVTGFQQPTSLEISQRTGDVWIIEEGQNRIIRLDASGGLENLPSAVSSDSAVIFRDGFNAPHRLYINNMRNEKLSSKVYITDTYDDQIERLSLENGVYRQASSVDLLFPTPMLVAGLFLNLKSIVLVVNSYGRMEVFEEDNILQKTPLDGNYTFVKPNAMIIDEQTNECWIGDNGTNQLVKIKINSDYTFTLLRKIGGFLSIKDIAINK